MRRRSRAMSRVGARVVGVGVLVWASLASAQCPMTEVAKLTASDAAATDWFGGAVGISGDLAVVGVPWDDNALGTNAGAAYAYRRVNGQWVESQKLLSNEQSFSWFGYSVSLHGDLLAIGSATGGEQSVSVYRWSGATWLLEQKVLPTNGQQGERFGQSVAIAQDVLVAGAYRRDVGGTSQVGGAYVFRHDGAGWVEEGLLEPSNGDFQDRFGESVAVSGSTIVIGSPGRAVGSNNNAGAVHVYRRSQAGWALQSTLTASDPWANAQLGRSVSVSGRSIVAGAPQGLGAVYAFRSSGSGWVQDEVLVSPTPFPEGRLGYSVQVSGNQLIAGAPGEDLVGAAHRWQHDGWGWRWVEKLAASDGAQGENFGIAVAVSGGTALVGAHENPGGPSQDAGRAYVFQGVTKVPLGGNLTTIEDSGCYRVYVPTAAGGRLNVLTTRGTISELRSPFGDPYLNDTETGRGAQGWYTFVVSGTGGLLTTISTEFVQEGTAETVPWHFFYYPFRSQLGTPALHDDPGAYSKFDSHFGLGTASRDWELAHHDDDTAENWEGHCWGAALASIILEQPAATGAFTEDELEGLAADFFDDKGASGLGGNRLQKHAFPFESPTEADSQGVDVLVHTFHQALRLMLRDRRQPLHMDLRQSSVGGAPEVWNQGCYTYRSVFREDPAALGDPETDRIRQMRIETHFITNGDFAPPTSGDPVTDPARRREQVTEYRLLYSDGGLIWPVGSYGAWRQNWLSMKLSSGVPVYVPSLLSDVSLAADEFVDDVAKQGKNPLVNGHQLIELGLKKSASYR